MMPYHISLLDTRSRIYAIARDVGNPSTLDPFFPTVRHKDWFMGMSWATGIIGGARQAESSTEVSLEDLLHWYYWWVVLLVGLDNNTQLKCYSQILCGGPAENFRFWLFCTDLMAN